MRPLSIIFGLLYCFDCLSQTNKALSIELTPLYSYRYYKSKDNGNIKNKYLYTDANTVKKHADSLEQSILGYSLGVNYIFIKKKYNFSLGLYYTNSGETERIKIAHTKYSEDSLIYLVKEENFNFRNTYHQINFPCSFYYPILNEKLNVYVRIGAVISYVAKRTVRKPEYYNEIPETLKPVTKEYFAHYNAFLFGFTGGIKFEKKINNTLSWGIEPIFNIQVTPTLSFEKELMQYNYYGGLAFSIAKNK